MLYDQMIRSLDVRGHLVVPSFESRLSVLPHTQNSFSNIFSFSNLLLFFIPNISILPITPLFFSFLGKMFFPLPPYFFLPSLFCPSSFIDQYFLKAYLSVEKLLSLDQNKELLRMIWNCQKYCFCWVTSPAAPLSALLSSRLSVTWRTKVIKNSNLEKRVKKLVHLLLFLADDVCHNVQLLRWRSNTIVWKKVTIFLLLLTMIARNRKVTKFNGSTASRCSSDFRVPWGPLAFYWVVPALSSSSFCSNFAKMLIWMLLCRMFDQMYYY